jgi:hypothetical protein
MTRFDDIRLADSSALREIQRRLDTLAEQVFYLVEETSKQSGQDIRTIRENQQKIERQISKMAALSAKNQLAVEKTVLSTLLEYFDHVPPAIEAFVLKVVRDAAQEEPVSQTNSMSAGFPSRKCSRCNVEITALDRFCSHCGQPNSVELPKYGSHTS